MSSEMDIKIESIMLSVINRLYNKEATLGLDYEDLRCFEIVTKIKKDANPVESTAENNRAETDPELLANLIQRARKFKVKPDVTDS